MELADMQRLIRTRVRDETRKVLCFDHAYRQVGQKIEHALGHFAAPARMYQLRDSYWGYSTRYTPCNAEDDGTQSFGSTFGSYSSTHNIAKGGAYGLQVRKHMWPRRVLNISGEQIDTLRASLMYAYEERTGDAELQVSMCQSTQRFQSTYPLSP